MSDQFQVIEFHMLKTLMFLPLAGLGAFTVNTLLYPISLIRTRLVMQHGNNLYTGMIHGAKSIVEKEGWRGLYNGFFVKSIQLFSGVLYNYLSCVGLVILQMKIFNLVQNNI